MMNEETTTPQQNDMTHDEKLTTDEAPQEQYQCHRSAAAFDGRTQIDSCNVLETRQPYRLSKKKYHDQTSGGRITGSYTKSQLSQSSISNEQSIAEELTEESSVTETEMYKSTGSIQEQISNLVPNRLSNSQRQETRVVSRYTDFASTPIELLEESHHLYKSPSISSVTGLNKSDTDTSKGESTFRKDAKVPSRPVRTNTFPIMLHRMLQLTDEYSNRPYTITEGYETGVTSYLQEILRWEPHGRAFIILDKQKLVSNLCPSFFPYQTEYPSFQRQLNLYGFKRLKSVGKDQRTGLRYYHELFLRTRPDLCYCINRVSVKKQYSKGGNSKQNRMELEPNIQDFPPLLPPATPLQVQKPETISLPASTAPPSINSTFGALQNLDPATAAHLLNFQYETMMKQLREGSYEQGRTPSLPETPTSFAAAPAHSLAAASMNRVYSTDSIASSTHWALDSNTCMIDHPVSYSEISNQQQQPIPVASLQDLWKQSSKRASEELTDQFGVSSTTGSNPLNYENIPIQLSQLMEERRLQSMIRHSNQDARGEVGSVSIEDNIVQQSKQPRLTEKENVTKQEYTTVSQPLFIPSNISVLPWSQSGDNSVGQIFQSQSDATIGVRNMATQQDTKDDFRYSSHEQQSNLALSIEWQQQQQQLQLQEQQLLQQLQIQQQLLSEQHHFHGKEDVHDVRYGNRNLKQQQQPEQLYLYEDYDVNDVGFGNQHLNYQIQEPDQQHAMMQCGTAGAGASASANSSTRESHQQLMVGDNDKESNCDSETDSEAELLSFLGDDGI